MRLNSRIACWPKWPLGFWKGVFVSSLKPMFEAQIYLDSPTYPWWRRDDTGEAFHVNDLFVHMQADTIKHVPGVLWLQYCMFVYTIHYRYIDQQIIPTVLDSSDILLRDPRHDKARCQRLGIGLDSWCSFASFDTGIVGWNMDQHYSSFMFFCIFLWSHETWFIASFIFMSYIYIIYVSFS